MGYSENSRHKPLKLIITFQESQEVKLTIKLFLIVKTNYQRYMSFIITKVAILWFILDLSSLLATDHAMRFVNS